MNEHNVRERADAHGRATVAGDLKTASSYLDKSAYAAAGEVMKKMPGGLSDAEVTAAEQQGDRWLVTIRYSGSGGSTEVESTWAETDGEAKIVGLRVP